MAGLEYGSFRCLARPERRRPDSQPAELMPVKAAIYRTVCKHPAELNAGFEKVARDFKDLQQVGYFPADRLLPLYNLLLRPTASAWL